MARQPFVMKLFMKNKWNISPWMLVLMLLLELLLHGGASSAATEPNTTTNATCRHATDMWGDPDPNIFYVCSDGGQPLQLRCPTGRGFFNGLGHLGCLPFGYWPACQPAERAAKLSAAGCDGVSSPPWASEDPNQFYMCPPVGGTPLLLSCAAGKGFVATSRVAGCADWALWRQQMQCEAFY
ncbi:hypothetical protein KR018_003802 [Drosophila ironensis]|nr:hypothetical protein KR018_003802 [Drosophila ironensis]